MRKSTYITRLIGLFLIFHFARTLGFRILVLVSFVTLISCNSNSLETISPSTKTEIVNNETVKYDIPSLQKRSGALAEMPEWATIEEEGQNLYQKVRMTGDAKSALNLAAIYMQEARITGEHPYYYNAALDVLNIVINKPPKENIYLYQAYVNKASVMLSQHQFKEALALGEAALKIEDKEAQVYGVLCDANVELGNYEEAVKMGDKMVQMKPDLRSYARISYLRELHGDIDGAIEAMTMATKAGVPGQENTAWARITLADLYKEYGRTNQARQEIARCLSERSDFPFALASKADLELEAGNVEEANFYNEQAIALIPEFSFFVTKAKIQRERGEKEGFETTCKELLVMMEEDTESGHNMSLELGGIYLDLLDQPNKALEIVEVEYNKRKQNIDVNLLMGEILQKMGKYEEARAHFEVASRTNFQKPSLISNKTACLEQLKKKVM